MPGPDFAHGKDTYISIGGKDISAFTNTSELGRKGSTHDVTTYGSTNYADGRKPEVHNPGTVTATFKCGGVFDKTATTGTSAALGGSEGKKLPLIRRPLGTGTGKAEQTVDIVITDYTETSPVADMVTWQLEAQCSGVIAETVQA